MVNLYDHVTPLSFFFFLFLIGKMILFEEKTSTKCILYALRRKRNYIGPEII